MQRHAAAQRNTLMQQFWALVSALSALRASSGSFTTPNTVAAT